MKWARLWGYVEGAKKLLAKLEGAMGSADEDVAKDLYRKILETVESIVPSFRDDGSRVAVRVTGRKPPVIEVEVTAGKGPNARTAKAQFDTEWDDLPDEIRAALLENGATAWELKKRDQKAHAKGRYA